MSRRVVFLAEAEAEIAEAADWYETRGKGLGADFTRSLEATIAAIQRIPTQYQIVKGQARRAVLRRFPYSLVYKVSEHEIIVLACFHGRRDPRRLMERL
jgi:plasmid stabilization system protein ParE